MVSVWPEPPNARSAVPFAGAQLALLASTLHERAGRAPRQIQDGGPARIKPKAAVSQLTGRAEGFELSVIAFL
jgi:hypothetical protein